MTAPDVLVIGGGPSGLAAAIALRQRGASVAVLDALAPPIDKACGEGLMPDAVADLARLGVQLTQKDGAAFRGIRFTGWHGNAPTQVSARFSGKAAGVGVRRRHLHALLVARAAEAGVRMRWDTPAALGPGGRVKAKGAELRYGWLIGADGMSSRVRAWAGLDRARVRSRRFGFRCHYAAAPWSEFVEVHWSSAGQVYITPVGGHEICVATVSRHPGMRLDQVVATIPLLQARLSGAELRTGLRGSVTSTRKLHRVTTGRVALIGDASGSVDAVTGEGIALGFRQAMLLAESLERGGLEHYARHHAATLRMPQFMSGVLLGMDRHAWFRERAISMLARRPALFAGMLGVHLGEQDAAGFLLRHGLRLGWGLATSGPAPALLD